MKKIIRIITLLILVIITKNVYAYEEGDTLTRINFGGYNNISRYGQISINGRNSNLLNTDFTFQYDKNKNISVNAFCLDPSLQGDTHLKIGRLLNNNKNNDFYDTLFYYMLEYIYDNNYYKMNASNGNHNVIAANIALKAIENGFLGIGRAYNGFNSDHQNVKDTFNYLLSLGIKWSVKYNSQLNKYVGIIQENAGNNKLFSDHICNGSEEEIYKCRFQLGIKNNCYYKNGKCEGQDTSVLNGYTYNDMLNYKLTDSSLEATAEKIFQYALDRSLSKKVPKDMTYKRYDGAEEITNNNWESYTASSDDSNLYAIKNITIKIENKDDGNSFKYKSYTCTECRRNGVSIYGIEFNDKGVWKNLTSDLDLLPYTDTDGNIKLRIKMNKTIFDDCQNSELKLKFEVKDKNKKFTGAILYSTDETNREKWQRYITFFPETEISEWETSIMVSCTSVPCETKISTPICNFEESAIATVDAPDNIKKCIINNSDEAGNTYKSKYLSDNNYCKIFCKEDYAAINFNESLNGVRNETVDKVNCGTYFKLTASVSGTKSCYTTGFDTKDKSINREKFDEDLDKAQQELVDAYNEYAKIVAASNAIPKLSNSSYVGNDKKPIDYNFAYKCPEGTTYDSNNNNCVGTREVTASVVTDNNGNKHCPDKKYSIVEINGISKCVKKEEVRRNVLYIYCSTPGYSYSSQFNRCEGSCSKLYCNKYIVQGQTSGFYYDAKNNKVIPGKPLSYHSDDYGVSDGGQNNNYCSINENDCTPGKASTLTANLKRLVADRAKKVNEAMQNVTNIINEFNSCSIGWENTFQMENHKLEWEYGKKLDGSNDPQRRYYDMTLPSDRYMDMSSSKITSSKQEYCEGKTDDKYNCQGRLLTEVLQNESTIKCDINGCKNIQSKISQADFVKKTISKDADYITPTIFYQVYPLGNIVTRPGNTSAQTYALENGLPVDISSSQFGVYVLKLQNFGEFYDTEMLGRIFDFGGRNEQKSLSSILKQNGKAEFDGDFICDYKVPCDDPCVPYIPEVSMCQDPCVTCINCIFNYNELKLDFKTISSNNFNSVNRRFGFNWEINTNYSELALISAKASKTISEIESLNESIYSEENLEFSIELTPNMISDIKKYNKKQEKYGGYANEDVTCYNYNNYPLLLCYSDFLDELYAKYKNNFNKSKFTETRISSEDLRSRSIDQNNYWTLWPNYQQIQHVAGGPAWK